MLAAGSTEREVYDRLILDRAMREKFTPDELEDHVLYMVRITRELDKHPSSFAGENRKRLPN